MLKSTVIPGPESDFKLYKGRHSGCIYLLGMYEGKKKIICINEGHSNTLGIGTILSLEHQELEPFNGLVTLNQE